MTTFLARMPRAFSTTILAVLIVGVVLGIYAYPVLRKGYAPEGEFMTLITARNYGLAGTYAVEGENGVFLALRDAAQRGIVMGVVNPLTVLLYAALFRWTGLPWGQTYAISIAAFALFAGVLLWIGSYLFSRRIGVLAALFGALLPVMAVGAITSGYYEFAILFFGVGFSVFLHSQKTESPRSYLHLIVASVLFSAATLARNAFALSVIPIISYEVIRHRSYRRAAALIVPFVLLFGSTITPYSYLNAPNGYLVRDKIAFGQLGHLFNDPYSFYFNREAYLQNLSATAGLDRIGIAFAKRLGHPTSFGENIRGYWDAITYYPLQAVDLTMLGGAVGLACIALGFIVLWRTQRHLALLFVGWGAFWYATLVVEQFANWDHFIEILIPLALCGALGVNELARIIGERFQLSGRRGAVVSGVIALVVLGHLVQATRWRMHDVYRSSNMPEIQSISAAVTATPGTGVVAVGVHAQAAYGVAYLTGKSVVYFHDETVQQLLDSGKLVAAFHSYGVSVIAGYDEDLSARIARATGVAVIAPNSFLEGER